MVVALVDDLLFGSRIRAAAERTGRPIAFAKRETLMDAVAATPPHLVVVDLDRSQMDPMAAIRQLRAHPDAAISRVPIVAYVSHVRGDLIDAAREAGATLVLARSAFVAKLPELMADAPTEKTRAL